MIRKYLVDPYDKEEAGRNLSWRAILAGLATFVALMLIFSLIAAAIGLGVPTFNSPESSNVGTGLIIWIVVSLVLSLAGAGYVAGITANRAGFIHGFLTWAVSVIATFVLATSAVSSLVSGVGTALGYAGQAAGTVIQGTGQVVGNVASTAGSAVSSLTEEAFTAISDNLNVDTSELDETVTSVLEDTDQPQLQPDYLQNLLSDTVDDISTAAYNVVVDGQDAQTEIQGVTDNIETRLATVNEALDEEALANAIESNTDLNQQEAEDAVNNIVTAYEEAQTQVSDALTQAEVALNDLVNSAGQAVESVSEEVDQAVDQAANVAEDVSNSVATISLWTFVGLLIGMFITAFAGQAGTKTVNEARYDNSAIK